MINVKKFDNDILRNIAEKIRNKYILSNHLKVYRKLEMYRNLTEENETVELYFNEIIIRYHSFCMVQGINGGDEIMFCSDNRDDMYTEDGVVTILLKGNKTYEVIEKRNRGYCLEVIEK